jgi:hypothetical protein
VGTTAGDGDLEIGLRWDRRRDELNLSMRLEVLDANVDDWYAEDTPLQIDFDELRRHWNDEPKYGAALTEMVFGHSDVKTFYRRARADGLLGTRTLHLRLHISGPARVHAVRWESLRDPDTEVPLATQPNVLLSRYLSSPDWRQIPALARHELRALVVVAAPTDLRTQRPFGRRLADVDAGVELARARAALRSIPTVRTLSGGSATLARVLAALEGGIDILYLVCHGALMDDVPLLYLERPDRTVDVVDGRLLVERLAELDRRPTIAVLCSCQSAGAGTGTEPVSADGGELAALGPRLAGAGVAAVVGMQGDVSMQTAEGFLPAFFGALARDGVVDAAAAAGRKAVRDRPDWWAPVLFSRLRSGRTYYRPEFTERGALTWQTLELQVKRGNFTPVLGPDMAAAILGSRQDIARRWVRRWQMPIASGNQGDLAQVAQYLRVRSAPGTVRAQLQDHLETEIERRRDAAEDPAWILPEAVQRNPDPQVAISAVGRALRERDPGDPFRVMSALPVPVYVTTSWTNLLEDALVERGRRPLVMTFPWNTTTERVVRFEEPTPDRPLVYHLYGRLDDPETLVVTEDDYFAWMSAWSRRRKSIPPAVAKALTARSLLFLGYSLDDWDFRVVFQSIKCFGGSTLLRQNLHVGVQLAPENPTIEPEAAQEYLESYFGEDKVSIYWGEIRQFLDELRNRTGLET